MVSQRFAAYLVFCRPTEKWRLKIEMMQTHKGRWVVAEYTLRLSSQSNLENCAMQDARRSLRRAGLASEKIRWKVMTVRAKIASKCNLTRRLKVQISDVTRVGVTRGGNWGCHPYFFLKKLTTFSDHRLPVQRYRPCLFFPEKNWRPFYDRCQFYSFHSGVTPPEGVTPHLFTCPIPPFVQFSL